MKRIERYELIERYLLGKANPDEIAQIETGIKADPDFASQVDMHRNMKQLLIDHSLLEVKETLQQIRNQDKLNIRQRNRFYRGLIITSFCAFILTISLLLLNKKDIAVRPASEAPEASEAFSETTFIEPVHNLIPEKVQKQEDIQMEKTITPQPGEFIHTTPKAKEEDVFGKDGKTDTLAPEYFPKTDAEIPEKVDAETKYLHPADAEPCNLTADYLTEPSCNNTATGMIVIVESSVSGGIPPYKVILNGEYSDLLVHRKLNPGLYNLKIEDAAGCVKLIGALSIDVINCFEKDYRFSPRLEVWEIPLEHGKQGIVKIYNKVGQIVYILRTDGLGVETWNGSDINNTAMPLGLYPFTIMYDDGNTFEGTVTIVR